MLSKALKLQETSTFIIEWLKAPLVTASVIPSSKRLARKMVQDIHPGMQSVIELGPGTGYSPGNCWKPVCLRNV
ncbi:MAG: hypothetical protein R3E95_14260 [Thiolinea sp.]